MIQKSNNLFEPSNSPGLASNGPQSRDIVLETQRLTRTVQDKILVDDINLQVHWGEILAVLGPSGAGKSSFLRLLNRLDEPTGGTVLLKGQDYHQLSPSILRRRVGMMMQAAHLFPGTVAENVCFGPRQQGFKLSPEEIEALLREVGLAGFANQDVTHLSGGEAQRVSLARALANKPEVLLLDEPTSALDERAQREVEELLARILRDQNLTALMVTHDAEQATRITNRAILVHKGRLILNGTIQEALDAQSNLP